MRRTTFLLPVTLALASLMGGCGFLHNHFERKDAQYKKATQDRPLEVPPDLDTPGSSSAIVIPPASTAVASEPAAAAVPPALSAEAVAAAVAPVTLAPAASIEGGGLRIADTVESTFARVGLALQRSGAATITGRDDAGYAYAVETAGQAATEAGWFKRAITLGRAGKKANAKVPLTVRVSGDGSGSVVTIEGGADDATRAAAQSLLATLRQRLS